MNVGSAIMETTGCLKDTSPQPDSPLCTGRSNKLTEQGCVFESY